MQLQKVDNEWSGQPERMVLEANTSLLTMSRARTRARLGYGEGTLRPTTPNEGRIIRYAGKRQDVVLSGRSWDLHEFSSDKGTGRMLMLLPAVVRLAEYSVTRS